MTMVDLSGLGDKAKDLLNSDKGEQVSDTAISKAGDAANTATGGKFGDKIDGAQDAADNKVGN